MRCCGAFTGKTKRKPKQDSLALEQLSSTLGDGDYVDARSTISSAEEVGGGSPTLSQCSSTGSPLDDSHGASPNSKDAVGKASPFSSFRGGRSLFKAGSRTRRLPEATGDHQEPGEHGLQNSKAAIAALDLQPDAILMPQMRSSSLMCLFRSLSSRSLGQRYVRMLRPHANATFKERPILGLSSWEEPDACSFQVRGQDYMRTRKKVSSADSIYRLLGADIYSFDFKIDHIAQHIELPHAPILGRAALELPQDQQVPPLLILNIQLPNYNAAIFGAGDGPGVSLVFYFGLPDGWEPDQLPNKAALSLLCRFANNGEEDDRTPTRDRLKLIAQCPDPADWTVKAPLSSAEGRLLARYNGRPVMTRPQHRFYAGIDYLEADLDVHQYSFLARRALAGLLPRMGSGVFDFGFVLQGNNVAELPEQILACARISGVDVSKVARFPASPDS